MKTHLNPGVTPCPGCGQIGLKLETRPGNASPHDRIPLREEDSLNLRIRALPHLECLSGCGWQRIGRFETGYVVFTFEDAE